MYPELYLENGYIPVNEKMETMYQGVYAAGDICVKQVRQAATAVTTVQLRQSMRHSGLQNHNTFIYHSKILSHPPKKSYVVWLFSIMMILTDFAETDIMLP